MYYLFLAFSYLCLCSVENQKYIVEMEEYERKKNIISVRFYYESSRMVSSFLRLLMETKEDKDETLTIPSGNA